MTSVVSLLCNTEGEPANAGTDGSKPRTFGSSRPGRPATTPSLQNGASGPGHRPHDEDPAGPLPHLSTVRALGTAQRWQPGVVRTSLGSKECRAFRKAVSHLEEAGRVSQGKWHRGLVGPRAQAGAGARAGAREDGEDVSGHGSSVQALGGIWNRNERIPPDLKDHSKHRDEAPTGVWRYQVQRSRQDTLEASSQVTQAK